LPHIHELRDGDAFVELAVGLAANDHEYGGLLLNHQGVDLSFASVGIRPSDIVVLTTRPPQSDDPELHRLFIQRTKTDLEQVILNTMRRYFRKCSRARIILTEEFACKLKQQDRGDIIFTQYGPACYSELRNPCLKSKRRPKIVYKGPRKTAAFFLRTRLDEEGPVLLAAFSMDGPGTLTWCHLLRTRFSHLLTSERFVMAEITFSDFPAKPVTLSFAQDFETEFLLDQPLD
jgi:hypothetical protein